MYTRSLYNHNTRILKLRKIAARHALFACAALFAFQPMASQDAKASLSNPNKESGVFAAMKPVGDGELASQRGGFVTTNGLRIDFGFTQKTLVDGKVLDESTFLSDLPNAIEKEVRKDIEQSIGQLKDELSGGAESHPFFKDDPKAEAGYDLEQDLVVTDLMPKDNYVRKVKVDGKSMDIDLDTVDYDEYSLKEINLPKLLGSGIHRGEKPKLDHDKTESEVKEPKITPVMIEHAESSFLKTLIQVGGNNVLYNDNDGMNALEQLDGLVTIIQNSADNKTIQHLNVLDLTVSDFKQYKEGQMGKDIDQQLLMSLH